LGSPGEKPVIIVYHADCIDGAACAWIVAKAKGLDGDPQPSNVTYIPYGHHNAAESQQKIRDSLKSDAELYFVDLAPEKAFLDELMTSANGTDGTMQVSAIHIYDHHKTAAHNLKGYTSPNPRNAEPQLNIVIDDQRASASAMVWGLMMPGQGSPVILGLIDKMDGDAVGLKTPADFAAAALVDSYDISNPKSALETIKGLAKLSFMQAARRGAPLAADQDQRLKKLLDHPHFVRLQLEPGAAPVDVPIVNADLKAFGRRVSESLSELAKKHGSPAAFAWCMQANGAVTVSIRTCDGADASLIADYMKATLPEATGGGHAGAAAVHFPSLVAFAIQLPTKTRPAQPPVKKDGHSPKI